MRRGAARGRAACSRSPRPAAARSPRSASPTSSRARASSPRRPPTGTAPTGEGSIRIAVVTHGAAASAFWAIVKNGVDAAARQMNVSVSYRSPDTFNVERMKDADLRGGRLAARRPRRLDPDPLDRAGDPPRRAGRHPRRLDQLGREPVARPRRARPRRPARDARRLRRSASGWRPPACKRAICVKQELRNNALDQRCAGFARGMRAGGGSARDFVLDVTDRDVAAPKLRAELGGAQGRRRPDALERRGQDVARGQEAGRPRDRGRSSPPSTSRPRSSRRSRTGACCSRSTSRPTCRATCRS